MEQKLQSFKAILEVKNLTPENYDKSEMAIISFVQKNRFKSEIAMALITSPRTVHCTGWIPYWKMTSS